MSHCPGLDLEDWLTDWYRIVNDDGAHGTSIRHFYKGQLIFNEEQFAKLVEIHEPIREHVEELLLNYDEEENGSWRDYCGRFDVPDEIANEAGQYIDSIKDTVEKTKGISS